MDIETNQQINFLDLSENRKIIEFTLGTYRKPTYTDTVMRKSSNHPSNHKQAAFNCLLDGA
jgi:hypothetical protein